MKKEILISDKHNVISVIHSQDCGTWYFYFEEELSVQFECFWRLFSQKGIIWTSKDHLQTYGRESSIILEREIMELLKQSTLINIERNLLSGDLILNFDNDLFLEAYIDSIGYESWEINWRGRTCIGIGQEDVERFK